MNANNRFYYADKKKLYNRFLYFKFQNKLLNLRFLPLSFMNSVRLLATLIKELTPFASFASSALASPMRKEWMRKNNELASLVH